MVTHRCRFKSLAMLLLLNSYLWNVRVVKVLMTVTLLIGFAILLGMTIVVVTGRLFHRDWGKAKTPVRALLFDMGMIVLLVWGSHTIEWIEFESFRAMAQKMVASHERSGVWPDHGPDVPGFQCRSTFSCVIPVCRYEYAISRGRPTLYWYRPFGTTYAVDLISGTGGDY